MEVISPDGEQSTCSREAAERLQGKGWTIVSPGAVADRPEPDADVFEVLEQVTRDRDSLQTTVNEQASKITRLEGELASARQAPATAPPPNAPDPAPTAPTTNDPTTTPPVPPRGNESRDKWAEYAKGRGVNVAEDASRDAIKAAVAALNA